MGIYSQYKCPVCHKNFTDDDDIVVCPICGTPHHRECYLSQNKCAFSDKHGTDFDWKKELSSQPQQKAKDEETVDYSSNRCPRCGFYNKEDSSICKNCGFELYPHSDNSAVHSEQKAQNTSYTNVSNGYDPLADVGFNSVIDDVPAGDIAKFVGPNAQYYITVFSKIFRTKRIGRFNFVAFILTGPWMLFRKQYKRGIIFTSLLFLLQILSIVLSAGPSGQIATTILNAAGIESIALVQSLTQAQSLAMTNAFLSLSFGDMLLLAMPSIISIVNLGIRIWVGVCANKWYYKHTIATVKKINKTAKTTETFNDELYRLGGVNPALMVSLLVCYFIVSQYLPVIIQNIMK